MPSVKSHLQLLPGTVGAPAAEPETSFRLRPGERAAWVDVSATDAEMREWWRNAAAVGLSVDVWVALKLEWSLIRADVSDQAQLVALVEHARHEVEAARLAPSDELRRWLAFLGRGAQQQAVHDLPSIALPARVVARLAPAALTTKIVAEANGTLDLNALVVERAASLNGMTMESWAYRALASLAEDAGALSLQNRSVQRELKQDPIDRSKLGALKESSDDALPLIGKLLTDCFHDAASELIKRIDEISRQLGGVDDAASHARDRIAAAIRGEELKVSDVQLISALTSSAAAGLTKALRESGRVDAAALQVEAATGTLPDVPVLVMVAETSTIGTGAGDHATYMPDALGVVVSPAATDHTLRHELVHATQPRQTGCGPFARVQIIEGTTDALALEAGSGHEDLSYKAEAAAVLGWGDALERARLEWLRELNSTPTPEITMGSAMSVDGKTACGIFADAQFAAEGYVPEFSDRVRAARKTVRARLQKVRAAG
jgi:hypothetical protein